STFTITCSANPVAILPGEIVWPRPLPDPNPPPEYFTIHPNIHNSTGGENLTTGDQTSFNLTISYGYDSYTNFLWKIYDQNGTLVKEIPWTNIGMMHTLATYGNTGVPKESAPTYMFTKPGNYTATITPIDLNGNQIPQYGTSTSFNVTGPDISNTNPDSTGTGLMAAGLCCGMVVLILAVIGVIYLFTRKPAP
ncbi:MAG: hypothetical protein KAT70_09795, partial [Thermoplasmata archaeon]|nr:hypothetical protein [Thermoplasmata archaeon]